MKRRKNYCWCWTKGAVTIATNMAEGRGVDIKLTQEILDLGGLAIIGTERHESQEELITN